MRALITRSEPGASRMAQVLGAAGVSCTVHPLLKAEPTGAPLPGECFDHVIFVSEHAVMLGRKVVSMLADRPQWYAIGPATEAAFAGICADLNATREAQISPPQVFVPEQARSEGLLQARALQASALQGQKVLLVAGEDGRELIASTLVERGADVSTWLVYRRVATDNSLAQIVQQAPSPDLCVASSGFGLELLTRLWFDAGGGAEVPVCVPSPRIAAMAKQLGWTLPVLCSGASAEATLRGLADANLLDTNFAR